MLARVQDHERATVFVAEAQIDRLSNLAEASAAPGSALLRRELERAIVVREDESPQDFVKLGSSVEYEDLTTGRTRTVTLVVPEDADMETGRLSVVTPAGAALIGLTPGSVFSWTTDEGRPRALRILRVQEGT